MAAKVQTSWRQKIVLVVGGLFLGVILLEGGLRLGGFILTHLQERANLRSLREKSEYVIMCLGESTTALGGNKSYPRQLEKVLNERDVGIRFSVINKGISAGSTVDIMAQLEENLEKYRPDMVVAMMGANDGSLHARYGTAPAHKKFRVYKLFALLRERILPQGGELEDFQIRVEERGNPRDSDEGVKRGGGAAAEEETDVKGTEKKDYLELARAYCGAKRWEEAEEMYQKAVEINPDSDVLYAEFGYFYTLWWKLWWKHWEAIEICQKAIEINPDNELAWATLGKIYNWLGKWEEGEQASKRAVAINPDNELACLELACVYINLDQNREQIEKLCKKAISLNPRNARAYAELGWFFLRQGRMGEAKINFALARSLDNNIAWTYADIAEERSWRKKYEEADKFYEKASQIYPDDVRTYLCWSWSYVLRGEYRKAEEILKKAIEIKPESDKAYGSLAVLYKKMGEDLRAEDYFEKANEIRLRRYNPMTIDNYGKLKEIVTGKRIQLVCVQYPMRSVQALKKILPDSKGVVFVDNERVFKNAVEREGYDAIFKDTFAGDFGHCTPKGNRLLAENIAGVILKEVAGINPENRP